MCILKLSSVYIICHYFHIWAKSPRSKKKQSDKKKATQKFGNVERFNHNENKNRRLPNLTFKILWALLVWCCGWWILNYLCGAWEAADSRILAPNPFNDFMLKARQICFFPAYLVNEIKNYNYRMNILNLIGFCGGNSFRKALGHSDNYHLNTVRVGWLERKKPSRWDENT